MTLQCDVSAPFRSCGIRTYFNPQAEFSSCDEKLLLVGQALPGVTVNPMPVQVLSNEDTLFGVGSMAASMVKAARCQAAFSDIWVLALPDFGTKGQSVVTFSDAASLTQSEVVYLVVHGEIYSVTVSPGDTDAMVAAAMALVIDDARVTVTASGADLTIETVNGGDIGGWLDVRSEYSMLGVSASTTIGVSIVTTNGVGVPANPLPAVLGQGFTFVGFPYTDQVSQRAALDVICKTWSPVIRTRSEAFTMLTGDVVAAQALAKSLNAPQMHPAYYRGLLNPVYDGTAAYAMAAYQSLNACNSPLQVSEGLEEIELTCLRPAEPADWINSNDTDTLIGDGLSLINVNASSRASIGNFTTSYTQDENGVSDSAFSGGQQVAQLRLIAGFVEDRYSTKFKRTAIRADGYIPRAGQRVVTPAIIETYIEGLGIELSDMNLIEDPDAWASNVMVEWDGGNSCVNVSVRPDLVNRLCCTNLFINSVI